MECVGQSLPDLLVTDMMMPVMTGAELIQRLRADPAMARLPILAATGDSQLAGGADAVLPKPYQPAQVLAAADALLTRNADQT